MLIWVHVLSALSSIVVSSALVVKPAKRFFSLSYLLIGVTFASGCYLVVSLHVELLKACLSGLVYLGAVGTILMGAQRRAAKRVKTDDF